MKPDIVFYGDIVENEVLTTIEKVSKECDLLLIMGTSLSTYPISQYIDCFKNCDIVTYKIEYSLDCDESDKCCDSP